MSRLRSARALRRIAARRAADDALVAGWLAEHGHLPLEAFAAEVGLSWRRRQAALRRLIRKNEEAGRA